MKNKYFKSVVKIKDLGEIITGTTPPTKQNKYFEGEYYFIKPSDIAEGQRYIIETEMTLSDDGCEYQKRKLLPKNSICIVCIGTIGKMCLTSKYSFTNQQLNSIIVDQNKYDPLYLYYLMRMCIPLVKQLNAGSASGRENVNKSSFENIEIEVHERSVQRKIASVLSAYDDLIENNTRRIEILEEMARSLYNEWFVKFRFPGYEQTKMVDSELGLIPEGWEVGRLDDALILQRGFDLPTKQRQEGNVPVYASTGVTGSHNEAKVKAPGVVTGRSGSLGTVIYVDEDFWALNTTLWVKEFRRVTPLYAFYLLSNLGLEQFNSGAAVPTLNRNDVHSLQVVIPFHPILEQFDCFVKPLFAIKKNLQARILNLRCSRDLLLPKLISGEIDVENLAIEIEDLAT